MSDLPYDPDRLRDSDLRYEPDVPRRSGSSRRRLVLLGGVVVVVLVVGVALLLLRDGDDDAGGGQPDAVASVTAVADSVAGELAWERDDLIATAGSVGGSLASIDSSEFRFLLVDLLTGELRLDTDATPIRLWSDGAVLLYDEQGERVLVDPATGEERLRTDAFVVDDPSGGVLVGKDDDQVVAYDVTSGAELWRVDAAVDTGPWIDEGLVLWAAADGTLHTLGARDGVEVWTADGYHLDGTLRAPSPTDIGVPEADDGTVLVGGDTELVGLDPADGAERWSVGPWDPTAGDVVVGEQTIVVGVGERYGVVTPVGLEPATGDERWRLEPSPGPTYLAEIRGVGPGAIRIDAYGDDTTSTVVDLSRAAVVDPGPGACCVLAMDEDVVLVTSAAGALAVLRRGDGAERWATGSTDGFRYAVLVGDTVVALTAGGDVLGLALDDGHQVWRLDVELDAAALVPTAAGVVVLGDPTGVALIR